MLALRAKGETSPNPIVGAVIVKGGKVIAEGWHHRCGGDHAEIIALKKAGNSAQGARMYVTLEPCYHFGRTPPCVDAVIAGGIKEIFIGMKDPNSRTGGKSIVKMRRAGIKTHVGFLASELSEINKVFIKYITRHLPFVTAKCAQTLDGKIAASNGHSQWITGKKSRDYAHRLRDEFDAILVGINTVLKDNPGLNAARKSKKLKKIILDAFLRIPENAALFKRTDPADVVIAAGADINIAKYRRLIRRGVTILKSPVKAGRIDLKWLMKELARREISNLLIEGGGETVGSALGAGLIDKFLIFMAPKILGDRRALSAVAGLPVRNVNQAVMLKDLSFTKIGEDILIEGYVYGNR